MPVWGVVSVFALRVFFLEYSDGLAHLDGFGYLDGFEYLDGCEHLDGFEYLHFLHVKTLQNSWLLLKICQATM